MKNLCTKNDIVILWGDKDSSTVTMSRLDYLEKPEGMIDQGVNKGTCKKAEDTTLQDLKKIQDFLYQDFLQTNVKNLKNLCIQIVINQQNYMEQWKHTNSTTFMKLTNKFLL